MSSSLPSHRTADSQMGPLPPPWLRAVPETYPRLRHTTRALSSVKPAPHTVPHCPLYLVSRRHDAWLQSTSRVHSVAPPGQ